jgi:hypothetical protein
VSRLPFGIGSHRDGIPFDVEHTTETNEDVPKPEPESPVVSAAENAAEPVSIAPPVETEQDGPEEIVPSLPEVNLPTEEEVSPTPEPVRITAIPIMEATVAEAIPQIPLDTTSGEGIFAQDDDVIEVVFSDLEDTVVHVDHGVDDSFVQPQVVEYAEKTFTPFDLHPARAMTVQASNDESLKALVESGFVSIGQGDWRSAARSFQRVLASVPGDVGAMNNYGIALLQVATTMQESADPVDVSNAATQFEAAILSLREAVRANTDHPEPLYNLAQALLLSGREEKALGLVGMASETEKSKSHFVNLHAAILAQMGQYGEAKTMLASIQGEPLVSQNLLKLPSL